MNFRCLVLVIISLVLTVKCDSSAADAKRDEKVLKKYTETLNNFRRQLPIEGMRRMYWDEELVRLAKSKVESCDRESLSHGNDGSFSIGLGEFKGPVKDMHTLATAPDSSILIRNTLDRQMGVCKTKFEEKACRETLQLFNPKVWLIGCAINYQCESETLIVCAMNRRMTDTKLPMRASAQTQPTCTESFKVVCQGASKCFCELKDPSLPRNLPEDGQELVMPISRPRANDEEQGGLSSTVSNSAFKHHPSFPIILFILTPLLTLHFH